MTAAEDARRHAHESISESLRPTDPRKVQRSLDHARRELRGLLFARWYSLTSGVLALVTMICAACDWVPSPLGGPALIVFACAVSAFVYVVHGLNGETNLSRARRRVGDLEDRWDDLKEQQ